MKKSLRAQLYAKFLRLGVRETKTVKPAGLTQLATEGIEQLDLCHALFGSLTLLCYPALYFKKKLDALS